MTRWDRRIERAGELEGQYPAAAEILRFYRGIMEFQKGLCAPVDRAARLPALLDLVRRTGPALLAEQAASADPLAGPAGAFLTRVLEQPGLESSALLAAARGEINTSTVQAACPFCSDKPVVAVLHVEGEGGKRSLVCNRCFTEWEFRRLLCPGCGEEEHAKLPVYTAAEFEHVRVEACDSCGQYIKCVDLTRNGLAVPEVDELAAVPLDLWAEEKGYRKLQANILAM